MATFADAHAAIDAQDPDRLRELLDARPQLVDEAGGDNGNRLLGMATYTCDERLVALLLDRGADVNGANVHGWTALHQVAYANATHLVDTLLTAGADPTLSARGDGGTPFVVAAFWGNTAVTTMLPRHPGNLRAGASAGDLSALGTAEAGAHRAYYRPHSGFPEWTPSDDPQEVLDEALCWAARCGRADVLGPLVAAGADLEADVYRGTALTWAATAGAAAAVTRLLELGADVSARGTFGGPTHGEGVTALHVAAQAGQAATVELLLQAGADTAIIDALHGGDPSGWAENGGHPDIAGRIRQAA